MLAAERPELRVYVVDPGDMRTQMHQDAFPGEDISDRPLPEASVPGLLAIIEGDLPSGRYEARALAPARSESTWDGVDERRRRPRRPSSLPDDLSPTRRPEARGLAATRCGCWSPGSPRTTRRHDVPAISRLRRPR